MTITLNCPTCGKHAKTGTNHCEDWGKDARGNCSWIVCKPCPKQDDKHTTTVYDTKSGGSYRG